MSEYTYIGGVLREVSRGSITSSGAAASSSYTSSSQQHQTRTGGASSGASYSGSTSFTPSSEKSSSMKSNIVVYGVPKYEYEKKTQDSTPKEYVYAITKTGEYFAVPKENVEKGLLPSGYLLSSTKPSFEGKGHPGAQIETDYEVSHALQQGYLYHTDKPGVFVAPTKEIAQHMYNVLKEGKSGEHVNVELKDKELILTLKQPEKVKEVEKVLAQEKPEEKTEVSFLPSIKDVEAKEIKKVYYYTNIGDSEEKAALLSAGVLPSVEQTLVKTESTKLVETVPYEVKFYVVPEGMYSARNILKQPYEIKTIDVKKDVYLQYHSESKETPQKSFYKTLEAKAGFVPSPKVQENNIVPREVKPFVEFGVFFTSQIYKGITTGFEQFVQDPIKAVGEVGIGFGKMLTEEGKELTKFTLFAPVYATGATLEGIGVAGKLHSAFETYKQPEMVKEIKEIYFREFELSEKLIGHGREIQKFALENIGYSESLKSFQKEFSKGRYFEAGYELAVPSLRAYATTSIVFGGIKAVGEVKTAYEYFGARPSFVHGIGLAVEKTPYAVWGGVLTLTEGESFSFEKVGKNIFEVMKIEKGAEVVHTGIVEIAKGLAYTKPGFILTSGLTLGTSFSVYGYEKGKEHEQAMEGAKLGFISGVILGAGFGLLSTLSAQTHMGLVGRTRVYIPKEETYPSVFGGREILHFEKGKISFEFVPEVLKQEHGALIQIKPGEFALKPYLSIQETEGTFDLITDVGVFFKHGEFKLYQPFLRTHIEEIGKYSFAPLEPWTTQFTIYELETKNPKLGKDLTQYVKDLEIMQGIRREPHMTYEKRFEQFAEAKGEVYHLEEKEIKSLAEASKEILIGDKSLGFVSEGQAYGTFSIRRFGSRWLYRPEGDIDILYYTSRPPSVKTEQAAKILESKGFTPFISESKVGIIYKGKEIGLFDIHTTGYPEIKGEYIGWGVKQAKFLEPEFEKDVLFVRYPFGQELVTKASRVFVFGQDLMPEPKRAKDIGDTAGFFHNLQLKSETMFAERFGSYVVGKEVVNPYTTPVEFEFSKTFSLSSFRLEVSSSSFKPYDFSKSSVSKFSYPISVKAGVEVENVFSPSSKSFERSRRVEFPYSEYYSSSKQPYSVYYSVYSKGKPESSSESESLSESRSIFYSPSFFGSSYSYSVYSYPPSSVYSYYSPPYSPIIIKETSVKEIGGIPNIFGIDFNFLRSSKSPIKYTPSVVGIMFNIKAKKEKSIYTGSEIRGIKETPLFPVPLKEKQITTLSKTNIPKKVVILPKLRGKGK